MRLFLSHTSQLWYFPMGWQGSITAFLLFWEPFSRCSIWYVSGWKRRGHCAVLNLTFIQISSKSVMCWSMCMHCHHASWHAVWERKGQRKREAERPHLCLQTQLTRFLFPLSATAFPHQTGGRKESLVPSAAAYPETQCLSSLWVNCYTHNSPGKTTKATNENNTSWKARLPWQFYPSYQSLPNAKLAAEEFPILPFTGTFLCWTHKTYEKGKRVTAVLKIYIIPV